MNITKEPVPTDRGWHSRGYLPHYDVAGLTQSVTIRLCDSLPVEVIRQLNDGTISTHEIDAMLDSALGACWLQNPEIAALVEESLLCFDGTRYRLLAWCIMPNHAHALLCMLPGQHLGVALRSWKSYSARAANRLLQREGGFWQMDYFDRFMRSDDHLMATLNYIENNPVKAGLVGRPEDWRWSSAWRRERELSLPPPTETSFTRTAIESRRSR